HSPDRPHRARASDFGKAVVNARGEPDHSDAGITAPHHARGAGVVLLAGQHHPVIPDTDDCLDDADAQPAGVKRVALLDMGFQIAEIARWVDALAQPSGEARPLERLL